MKHIHQSQGRVLSSLLGLKMERRWEEPIESDRGVIAGRKWAELYVTEWNTNLHTSMRTFDAATSSELKLHSLGMIAGETGRLAKKKRKKWGILMIWERDSFDWITGRGSDWTDTSKGGREWRGLNSWWGLTMSFKLCRLSNDYRKSRSRRER